MDRPFPIKGRHLVGLFVLAFGLLLGAAQIGSVISQTAVLNWSDMAYALSLELLFLQCWSL